MRKYLFLCLTIACFIAIAVVFVFGGYLGIYDSATIQTDEFTQQISAGFWPQSNFPYSVSSPASQKIFFTYQINNRTFTTYLETVSASLWQQNSKVKDLYSQSLEIKPFKQASAAWQVDPAGMNLGSSQTQFTVRIEQGGTVREVIVSFYSAAGTAIPGIVPPPSATK